MSETRTNLVYNSTSSYAFGSESVYPSHGLNSPDSIAGLQTAGDDDSEDVMVDLSSGSLVPVNLRNWTLMTEVVDKLGKL